MPVYGPVNTLAQSVLEFTNIGLLTFKTALLPIAPVSPFPHAYNWPFLIPAELPFIDKLVQLLSVPILTGTP